MNQSDSLRTTALYLMSQGNVKEDSYNRGNYYIRTPMGTHAKITVTPDIVGTGMNVLEAIKDGRAEVTSITMGEYHND